MAFTTTVSSREEASLWLDNLFADYDKMDVTTFGRYIGDDTVIRYGNNEEVVGLENNQASFGRLFALLKSMKHVQDRFDLVDNKIYRSSFVTQVVANDPEGREITLPGMAIFYLIPVELQKKGEPILKRLEVFVDLGPVYKRVNEVAVLNKESWNAF